jgi:4'-phosphopantetheinyl transferase
MLPPTAELHVWRAELDRPGWPGADRLPAEERARAARMRRPQVHRRWVAARWALRGAIGHYLQLEPESIELRRGAHGKPELAAAEGSLQFNLSHSGDRAVIAIAGERRVGVDIERIEQRRDVLTLARRALDPAEAREVAEAPAEVRQTAFHAAWTRREAIAKCLGTGLAAELPAAAVAVSNFDAGAGYAAAIAVDGDTVPPLRLYTMAPELLPRPSP